MRNIRRRLEALELRVDASEMAPNRIRAAMRAWKEHGELPTSPKLKDYITSLYATLAAMRATIPGWADEPLAPTTTRSLSTS